MDNLIPNLSSLAETEITINDLDSILEQETNNSSFGLSNMNQSNDNNNTFDNSSMIANPYNRQEDPFQKEMTSILDEDINNSFSTNNNSNQKIDPYQEQVNTPPIKTDEYYQYQNDDKVDPYALAFDLIQEMDLIRLPQGIESLSPEEIKYYKDQTLISQREEAFEFLRSQVAHDPYMLEIFEYTMEGAGFADIPKFKALTNFELDYETLNVNDQNTQMELVKQYLSDGLNPNNKKDKELLSYIPDRIDKLIETDKLKEKALQARDHFVNQIREQKQIERQMAVERRQQYEYQQYLEQQEQIQWDKDFKDALHARKWSDAKKYNIIKENQLIQLEDGSRIPTWEYKRQIIFNDPYLFQQFLDFTSKLDLQQGDFINMEHTDEPDMSQTTINKILERAVQKSQTTKKNSSVTSKHSNLENPQTKNVNQVADPNQWF